MRIQLVGTSQRRWKIQVGDIAYFNYKEEPPDVGNFDEDTAWSCSRIAEECNRAVTLSHLRLPRSAFFSALFFLKGLLCFLKDLKNLGKILILLRLLY